MAALVTAQRRLEEIVQRRRNASCRALCVGTGSDVVRSRCSHVHLQEVLRAFLQELVQRPLQHPAQFVHVGRKQLPLFPMSYRRPKQSTLASTPGSTKSASCSHSVSYVVCSSGSGPFTLLERNVGCQKIRLLPLDNTCNNLFKIE